MYAARNISLCTKDCACLFVCPTGATDTETGQIDKDRCLDGCRQCVDACPSGAIYLVRDRYPEPPAKNTGMAAQTMDLGKRKAAQESIAKRVAASGQTGEARLARGLAKSIRILGEDCVREAGYLHPQCRLARELAEQLA